MKFPRDEQGRIHRADGPACESTDGSFVWYRHGQIHRADGPAVRLVFADRTEEQFWLFGKEMHEQRLNTKP